jgi:hypothetical protein
MLYSYIVKKRIQETFDHVNNHRWDEAPRAVAPRVHHRVSGAHALGGERHDRDALLRWFERFGSVQPSLQLKINNIWVVGSTDCLTARPEWARPAASSRAARTGAARTARIASWLRPIDSSAAGFVGAWALWAEVWATLEESHLPKALHQTFSDDGEPEFP